jgi:hypothetical protein
MKRNWFSTTPRRLQAMIPNKSGRGRLRRPERLPFKTVNTTAAPTTRKATRVLVEIVRSAIFPSIGQVPNIS